jgi:hypothetical protein
MWVKPSVDLDADSDADSGLLLDLAHRRLSGILAGLDHVAGKTPTVVGHRSGAQSARSGR